MRRQVFPNSGPSRVAVIASCRHQLFGSSPVEAAAFSIAPYSLSVSLKLKLTDLVRFASLIFLFLSRARCAHIACVSVGRIRVNHCKGWTKPMYTRRVNATATRAGVTCLTSSGAEHLLLFSHVTSRLVYLRIFSCEGYV